MSDIPNDVMALVAKVAGGKETGVMRQVQEFAARCVMYDRLTRKSGKRESSAAQREWDAATMERQRFKP
jgi:hypothetical protein